MGRRRDVDCGWPPKKENGANAQTDIKLRHFTFISRKLFIFTRTTEDNQRLLKRKARTKNVGRQHLLPLCNFGGSSLLFYLLSY